jgi:signal transduction histidine kinase
MRIARELHDVLAHSISVINVQAGVALHLLERDEVTFAVELRGTPDQFRQAVALGRRLTPQPAADPFDTSLRYAVRR